MKTKILTIVAALALAFTLTGCIAPRGGGFGRGGGFHHGPAHFSQWR